MAQRIINNSLLDVKPQLNLLANGGFEMWNNGTAFNGLTLSGIKVADGWATNASGVTINVNREATEIASPGSKYSLKFEVVSPAGLNAKVVNSVPRVDLIGKTIFASIRVKTTIANGIRIELSDGVTAAYSAYHTGSGNWETLSVSLIPGSTMSVLHFAIGFELTTVATGIFYADNAMVVVGDKAVDYVPENPELDKVKFGVVTALQSNQQNLLCNGGFERWDFGTSFSDVLFPVGSQKFCHGWNMQNGAGTTWSREAGAGNFDTGLYSLKVVTTSASWYVTQEVYSADKSSFYGQTITLSVRIKTSDAGKFRIGLGDSISVNTFSSFHSGSGNWETLTVTKTIANNTSYVAVLIGIMGMTGACTGYIDSCMMVFGSQAVPFAPSDFETSDKLHHGFLTDLTLNIPNLLVNGGMEVWQRGTSFSSPATNAFTADKWFVIRNGSTPPTFVISQQSSASAHDFGNGTYGMLIAISSAGTASDSCGIVQEVEFVGRRKGRGPLTLTAKVRTNIANRVRIKMHDGVTAVYGAYHTGDDTWQTLTCTITPSFASATMIRCYVGINEDPGYGTGNIYVDSVMLTYGITPIPFYPEDTQIEFARCQRYCQVLGGDGTSAMMGISGQCITTTVAQFVTRFPEMASTPVATVFAPTSFRVYNAAGSGIACATLACTVNSPRALYLYGTVASGLVAGNASQIYIASSSAYVLLEA